MAGGHRAVHHLDNILIFDAKPRHISAPEFQIVTARELDRRQDFPDFSVMLVTQNFGFCHGSIYWKPRSVSLRSQIPVPCRVN
jgi:hypothetical protein